MLLLPATAPQAALGALGRVHESLRRADWAALGAGITVTTSAGLAEYRPGESAAELLRRADQALYRAKAEGRNCTRLASEPGTRLA